MVWFLNTKWDVKGKNYKCDDLQKYLKKEIVIDNE